MKEAREITEGESLILASGQFDKVVSINHIEHYGKVYNLRTDADTKENEIGQIIVAQGFLSGSTHFQNEGIIHINRIMLRHNIPDSIVN